MSSIVARSIEIAASPDQCWKIFSDFATWSSWFPKVRRAHQLSDRPWEVGGRFRMVVAAGPLSLSIEPTVQEIAPPHKVRWIGHLLGVQGNHLYTFEPLASSRTRATSSEEFSGIGSRLLSAKVLERLDQEIVRSMERLKSLIEESAAGGTPVVR